MVLGQYIGIGMLVAISTLGSFLPLVVPPYIIGLLGIVPIIIGAKKLVQILRKADKVVSSKPGGASKELQEVQGISFFSNCCCRDIFKCW